jgi:hypothetical protein
MHRRRRSDSRCGGVDLIPPIDPAIHQQLERAVEACGLSPADVTITYEDWLQSEQILVKSKSLSDEQLRCLSSIERASPHPIVVIANADLTKRNIELQHERDRADAKQWLRERGLFDSLPEYDPKSETVPEFAKRMERFCGIKPGSVLTLHELGVLTFKPEWAETQLRGGVKLGHDKFWCLMHSLSASNLEEHGVRFAIIGNEAYSNEEGQK